ncbi:hypothetical protein [Nocardia wallacei]|uniref:hypothetical protein n=1 Tax=Nocardia wallacei TaxID=480035 RepID=UPI002454BEF8|nr:hypothetical protein [Nocardia wallacei]
MVIDECGVLTVEDIAEELIGEISVEHDDDTAGEIIADGDGPAARCRVRAQDLGDKQCSRPG